MKTASITILAALIVAVAPVRATDASEPTGQAESTRVIHFPTGYSIGRVFVGDGIPRDCWWNESILWTNRFVAQARGTVKVNVGERVRLNVQASGPAVLNALRALKPGDIDHICLHYCKSVDDRLCRELSRLTGLDDIMLGQSTVTDKGIKCLASMPNLRCLSMACTLNAEDLQPLADADRLEYLGLSGPAVCDATLAFLPRLTGLSQLSIGGSRVGAGLQYVAQLKSLQYLNLEALSTRDIDRHLRHIGSLAGLRRLNLKNTAVGDAGLYHLRSLTALEELELFSNPSTGLITGRGLQNLAGLKSLRRLYLPTGRWTDEQIAFLAGLGSLAELNLWSDGLTDKALTVLARMDSLADLDLRSSRITDAGIESLSRCRALKSLTLSVPVHDQALRHLSRCPNLSELSIWRTEVKGDDLKELAAYPALTDLTLSRVDLGPNGAAHLGSLKKLRTLRIYLSPGVLTDDDLADIARITSLEMLHTSHRAKDDTAITDAGIGHLAQLPNLRSLYLSLCPHVTDEGFEAFLDHPKLEYLRLGRARVRQSTIAALKSANPNLEVIITP